MLSLLYITDAWETLLSLKCFLSKEYIPLRPWVPFPWSASDLAACWNFLAPSSEVLRARFCPLVLWPGPLVFGKVFVSFGPEPW